MGKRKIDDVELTMLATTRKADGSALTQAEMAEHFNVTVPAINQALKRIPKSVLGAHDAESWRKNRADIFAEMQRLILQYITPEKLKKASLQQLGTIFGIMYDKEKKETDRHGPTNLTQIQVNNIDPQAMKHIKDAIAAMTQQKLAEAAQVYVQEAEVEEEDEEDK